MITIDTPQHLPDGSENPRWLQCRLGIPTASQFGRILTALILGLKTEWNWDALFDYTDRYIPTERAHQGATYSTEIAVGVWAGFDEKLSMGRRMTGGRVSCPIWANIMMAHYRDHKGDPFPEPEGIVRRVICEESGLLMSTGCPEVRREVFIEGTEPRRYCDRHSLTGSSASEVGASYEDLDRNSLDPD